MDRNFRYCMWKETSTLTRGFHCQLNDTGFAGYGDDDDLEFGDDASFVEILSCKSSRTCGPFLGDRTFQSQDFLFPWCPDEVVKVSNAFP